MKLIAALPAIAVGALPVDDVEVADPVQVVGEELAEAGVLAVREVEGVFGGGGGVDGVSILYESWLDLILQETVKKRCCTRGSWSL